MKKLKTIKVIAIVTAFVAVTTIAFWLAAPEATARLYERGLAVFLSKIELGDNAYFTKLRVGTGSTSGHGYGVDDGYIEGDLEVDGMIYADGGVTNAGDTSVTALSVSGEADFRGNVTLYATVTATDEFHLSGADFKINSRTITITKTDTADGTVAGYRLVKLDSSGDLVAATVDSENVVGVNLRDASFSATESIEIGAGYVYGVAASSIAAGAYIKAADGGRVTQCVTNDVSGVTIGSGSGGGFGNQPAGDAVEMLSDTAGDSATCTVIGVTGETVSTEDLAIAGTTVQATSKNDWDEVLAVKCSGTTSGTLTVREASGDQEITTLAAGADPTAGVVSVSAGSQPAFNVKPTSEADDATTKMIGIKYTQTDGTTVAYQADQLNGATAQTFGTAALLVTEIYVGDVEAARTATVKIGAEEDELHCIGKSYTAAAARDENVEIYLRP